MVAKPIERIDRRKDGSIKVIGCTIKGMLMGYWEWFRKDGAEMRCGLVFCCRIYGTSSTTL
jgi:hypothetical protein